MPEQLQLVEGAAWAVAEAAVEAVAVPGLGPPTGYLTPVCVLCGATGLRQPWWEGVPGEGMNAAEKWAWLDLQAHRKEMHGAA